MQLRTLGIINNRITVGINTTTNNLFVHASSNLIEMSLEETECLMAVLTIGQMLPLLQAYDLLKKKFIRLWEPTEPTEPCKGC